MIRLVGGPISGKGTGPMPMIVHPLSASSRGTQVSSASGLATMLIGIPVQHLERRTSPLTARSSTPMSGRATGGAFHLMPLSVMVCTSGRGMMTAMAAARSTAIPARGDGAALRTDPRSFRGVHKRYLHLYVATYEAIVNAKRVTPELIRQMGVGHVSAHTNYT